MGEIINDLLLSLAAHLESKLIDDVPEQYATLLTYTDMDGESQVFAPSLVKIGPLQDDPTDLSSDAALPSALVSISENDPADMGDGWKHEVVDDQDEISVRVGYPREIGGATAWWRRFTVTMDMYMIDSDQSQAEAHRLGNLCRALLEKYCDGYTPNSPHGWRCATTDMFGETALHAYVARSHAWQGGGPDDDYIWRGTVWVQVLTVRE